MATLLAILLVLSVLWPPLTAVATGQTPEYPDLRPQVLRYTSDLVLERALQALESDGWRVVTADRGARLLQAERDAFVLGHELITVEVEPFGAGSRVHVRSALRDAPADFGQNARNIRQFQATLEQRLELARQVR